MATALEECTTGRSPICLKIPRDRILQTENKHTNYLRQRGAEEEADYTKAKAVSASTQAPCVEGVSQETQEVEKNSKVDDNQRYFFLKQAKQIPPRTQLCLPPHKH
jgi:hypothetical protein